VISETRGLFCSKVVWLIGPGIFRGNCPFGSFKGRYAGRIGRVLNNYLLMRDGFVPINIKFIDRADYYTAFNEFNESGKTKTMENI
jgi:hypothetical protein